MQNISVAMPRPGSIEYFNIEPGFNQSWPQEQVSNQRDLRAPQANNNIKKLTTLLLSTATMALATTAGYGLSILVRHSIRPDKGQLDMRAPLLTGPIRFEQCSTKLQEVITQAHEEVSMFFDKILAPQTRLTPKEAHDISFCFAKANESCVTYVCNPDKCDESSSTLGFITQDTFIDSKVFFCMNTLENLTYSETDLQCLTQSVVLHETAHYVNIEMEPDHNNGPNNDKVYQLGDTAESQCNARNEEYKDS